MKHPAHTAAVVIMMLVISTGSLYAFGSKERTPGTDEGDLGTEADREVKVILVAADESGREALSNALGAEAAAYLFQEYTKSSGSVQLSSGRKFSMPVKERSEVEIPGIPLAMEFRLELSPAEPLRYRFVEEIPVSFGAKDLLSPGRVRLQPATKALLEAAAKTKQSSGIMRLRSLTVDPDGVFSASVEVARKP